MNRSDTEPGDEFPTDEMTLRLLIEACEINPDTGQTHLQDFLHMGTRVKSRTEVEGGPVPVYEVEYEQGAAPWSPQSVIRSLATEVLRLRDWKDEADTLYATAERIAAERDALRRRVEDLEAERG